jgi:hypothetical protein
VRQNRSTGDDLKKTERRGSLEMQLDWALPLRENTRAESGRHADLSGETNQLSTPLARRPGKKWNLLRGFESN